MRDLDFYIKSEGKGISGESYRTFWEGTSRWGPVKNLVEVSDPDDACP